MNDLWAITAYFNPFGYRRRRENYGLFRKNLEVPLLTVELGYVQRSNSTRRMPTSSSRSAGGT